MVIYCIGYVSDRMFEYVDRKYIINKKLIGNHVSWLCDIQVHKIHNRSKSLEAQKY